MASTNSTPPIVALVSVPIFKKLMPTCTPSSSEARPHACPVPGTSWPTVRVAGRPAAEPWPRAPARTTRPIARKTSTRGDQKQVAPDFVAGQRRFGDLRSRLGSRCSSWLTASATFCAFDERDLRNLSPPSPRSGRRRRRSPDADSKSAWSGLPVAKGSDRTRRRLAARLPSARISPAVGAGRRGRPAERDRPERFTAAADKPQHRPGSPESKPAAGAKPPTAPRLAARKRQKTCRPRLRPAAGPTR